MDRKYARSLALIGIMLLILLAALSCGKKHGAVSGDMTGLSGVSNTDINDAMDSSLANEEPGAEWTDEILNQYDSQPVDGRVDYDISDALADNLPDPELGDPSRESSDVRLARLNAPTNLAASDGTYDNKVRVTWNHPTGEAPATYYIYRSITANNPSPSYIGARSYPGTYFDDTTAVAGTTYYYKAKSHKSGFNDSYFSNEDSGKRGIRLNTPTNLAASDGTYSGYVRLTWNHPTGEQMPFSYYIYRSTTANNPSPTYLGQVSYPNATYNDSTAVPGTTYYYKLKSHKTGYLDSLFSNEDSGYRQERLNAPFNVSASDGTYSDKVVITWSHPSSGTMPSVYYIYRSSTENDPAPTYIGGRSYPNTSYNDTTAVTDTTYFYKLKSHKSGCLDSYFSNEDSGYQQDEIWHTEVVESLVDTGAYTSIALDSNDHPHIGYHDYTNDDLKYAFNGGSSWAISTVDSLGSVGACVSIAIESNDHPRIGYWDYTNNDLKTAYYDGSLWGKETVDSTNNVGAFEYMAIDSNNLPHFSYYDWTNYDLKYAYFNGASWVKSTVDSSGDVGLYTSIAIDSNDHPHMSYCDNTNDDLKYAYYNGSTWEITSVDSVGVVGAFTCIAIDSTNRPNISYLDYANNDLKYTRYDGSSWNITIVDSIGDVGYETSIALDSNDHPHISYREFTLNDLKYAWFNGSLWTISTVDSVGDVGHDTSIALDSNDFPHISYFDNTNNDLKYAWYG